MSTHADALIKKGNAHLAEGKFSAAIKLFTKAIAADPRQATAYCRRAEAHYAHLLTLAEKPPKHARTHIEFEAELLSRKEFDLSLKDFNTAIRLSPDLAAAHLGQGAIHFDKGRHRAAIASFTNAISLQPDEVETYYRRAMAYEELDDDAGALADLDAIIRLDPDCADAFLEKGVIYATQEKYAEAVEEIDKAIALDPNAANYHCHRAMAMSSPAFNSGDETVLREALEYLDEAIRLEPKNAETHYNRGLIYGVLGESKMELSDFSTAIRLDPDYASAYRQRFQCFSELGKKEQAARDWAQYCARTKKEDRITLPDGLRQNYSSN